MAAPSATSNLQFNCPVSFIPCLRRDTLNEIDAAALVPQFEKEREELTLKCDVLQTKCQQRLYAEFFACRSRTVRKPEERLEEHRAAVKAWNDQPGVVVIPEEKYETQLEVALKEGVTLTTGNVLEVFCDILFWPRAKRETRYFLCGSIVD